MRAAYSFLILSAMYLIVQFTGLSVALDVIAGIEAGEITPVVADPESPKSSATIFAYILAMTAVLLILLKLGLSIIIKILMYVAMFAGSILSLTSLTGPVGSIFAVALVMATLIWRKNKHIMNVTLMFTIAGIGALLGASLSIIPALLLLLGLSVYDLVAVFGTKHMVTLAEKSKDKIPVMFLIPLGDRHLGLGTGDLAIPLTFTVSVLRDFGYEKAVTTTLGGLLGIAILYALVLNKKDATLPALPPMALGVLLGFTAGFI